MRCGSRRRWAIWWLCATNAFPAALWAADWSAQPWADARAEYSDNLQLRTGHTRGTAGGVINVGLLLKRADERGYLSLTPALRSSRYDSREPLDSNDQILTGAWSRRSEKGEWRLDGDWTRDTTLTSELEISGLIQTRKRRLRRNLSPSYSFALSPRSTIAADVAYTTVKYGDAAFTGLVNYDYARADASLSYQWSEQSTVTGTIYGARLEAAQIGNRTDTGGTQLQLSTALTERWDGTFGVGAYRNHGNSGGSNGNGGLIDLSLRRKDEKGEWRTGVNRSVDPSGTGVLVRRDQWNVGREQEFNDWWRLGVKVYWTVNKDLQSLAANQDRRYRSADIRLSRVLTRTWRVDAVYSYAWQRFAGEIDYAERNIVMLGVHYSGERGTE